MSESIYKWIVPDPVKPTKGPMHKSTMHLEPLAGSTLRTGAVGREGTFGRDVKSTIRPDNFTKAHEKTFFLDSNSLREWGVGGGEGGG